MGAYVGFVEIIFVFGLAVAFYVWQMRTLNRDIAERKRRESLEEEDNAR